MGQQLLVEKVSADGKINIPKHLRALFHLKTGDDVFWHVAEDGTLVAKIYAESSDTPSEVRRQLRRLAQRMDRSKSIMATLREVRGEEYQTVLANQEWVDQAMGSQSETR
ncbi:MAG: AbrB/MazE/SpoVT family DNA-binding domain-containing protein [Thermoflexales bacterium]|nr:AbrB/MazE/SpoVT family DNA-binding domain-containing protein [Thermoflexales bacterium]